MNLGIDFGTTHTGAAVYDNGQLRFIPLDWKNRQPQLLRSMIYVDRDQKHTLGMEAVRTYLEEDTESHRGRIGIYVSILQNF